jgi:alkylation response protein AidB-like acyl-CoA dehydrogenase
MLNTTNRIAYTEDHEIFRDSVRKCFEKVLTPHLDRHEEEGLVDREFWRASGAAGLISPSVPEEYGGMGLDFRFNAVITEELAYTGSSAGIVLQNDVCVDYLVQYGTDAQKQKWLPGCVTGEVILAVAMTEPSTGSDLQSIRTTAVRDGDQYVINGSKIYITNGIQADLIIVAVKTDPSAGAKGISLILVETDRPGFQRGRKLDKVGQRSADTAELFFNEVRVPVENILGQEGRGFAMLMNKLPQERLSIAVLGQAGAQRAFDEAVAFTKDRTAFGSKVIDFQNTRFELADMATKLQVGWAHLDWAILRHVEGKLTTAEASAAKLWHSELQCEICDRALQLHGGAGYMNEYPIARLWRDARVSRIYGGTSEIMKEVIGRTL